MARLMAQWVVAHELFDARRSLLSHVKGRARARVQPFDSHTIHTRAALAFMSAGHRQMKRTAITFVRRWLSLARGPFHPRPTGGAGLRVIAPDGSFDGSDASHVAPYLVVRVEAALPSGLPHGALARRRRLGRLWENVEVDADCNGRTCSRRGTLSGSGYLVTTALDGPPPIVSGWLPR